jgi:protocatechuate 3,4-dioxygenase beta subunit
MHRRDLLQAFLASAALPASPRLVAACRAIPDETLGPFPGDGTNGPNALSDSTVVRRDIRSSFGAATGRETARGVPLALVLQLVAADGCAPLAGRAVYVWHCDGAGDYSLYSRPAASQNYLRGVQVADGEGRIAFTTIFPGCYPGRWPHIHFEVYASLEKALSGARPVKVSQLALPEQASREVYAQSALYPGSLGHLGRMSIRDDGVFADDGAALQLAATTRNDTGGYVATLQVGL